MKQWLKMSCWMWMDVEKVAVLLMLITVNRNLIFFFKWNKTDIHKLNICFLNCCEPSNVSVGTRQRGWGLYLPARSDKGSLPLLAVPLPKADEEMKNSLSHWGHKGTETHFFQGFCVDLFWTFSVSPPQSRLSCLILSSFVHSLCRIFSSTEGFGTLDKACESFQTASPCTLSAGRHLFVTAGGKHFTL